MFIFKHKPCRDFPSPVKECLIESTLSDGTFRIHLWTRINFCTQLASTVEEKNWTLASVWCKMAFFKRAWHKVKVLPRLNPCRSKAHRGICLPNHFIPYFRAPGVKAGVKRSEKLQGIRIFRFEPLFFSQNWRIFKNVQNSTKNCHFGVVFPSLFNCGWKTAALT